ncbi:carbon storage regulator CsrA [Paenibacillus sp. Marseille-Q4541]|uniref:carbon storage regulator CsrA n=1 Tax=Paenibacillus sp. Marseille-Q4541 TaxID=2831522 RepID=UPI001BAC38E3|nr:carbon storage regulator CsrA [Paenibacillus sp. Marseille-Q4541]
MLVLSRKKGESIMIGEDIEITILGVDSETVRIGVKAPRHVDIYRKEIYEEIERTNQEAVIDIHQLQNLLTSLSKKE